MLEGLAGSEDPAELAELLWAAGFSGRPSAIELALGLLDHPQLGALAGELICSIAGLSARDETLWLERPSPNEDASLPPLELEDLDADLSLRPEDLLPQPNPEAFAAWWASEGRRSCAVPRLLGGQPWTAAGLLHQLRRASLRRRHAWSLEIAIRSGGQLDVDTRGWAHAQLEQLRAATPEALSLTNDLGPRA